MPKKLKCDTKTRFKDKKAALGSIHDIHAKDNSEKKPIRAYECAWCGHWHLTSMKKDEYENEKSKRTYPSNQEKHLASKSFIKNRLQYLLNKNKKMRYFETSVKYGESDSVEITRCKTINASQEAIDQFIFYRFEAGMDDPEGLVSQSSAKEITEEQYEFDKTPDIVEMEIKPDIDAGESFTPFNIEFYMHKFSNEASRKQWEEMLETQRSLDKIQGDQLSW